MKQIKTIAFYLALLFLLVAGMSLDISARDKSQRCIEVTRSGAVEYVRLPYNKDYRERHNKTHRLQRKIQASKKSKYSRKW